MFTTRSVCSFIIFVFILTISNCPSVFAFCWGCGYDFIWHGGSDCNWCDPCNWVHDGGFSYPLIPGPNEGAIIEPYPGPCINCDAACSVLLVMHWAWAGAQDTIVEVDSGSLNAGEGIWLAAGQDFSYDLNIGYAGLTVRGGTVTTPGYSGVSGGFDWSSGSSGSYNGLVIGGGSDSYQAFNKGKVKMYGGLISVPRIALYNGDITLYGGTLECTGDGNFIFFQDYSTNRIDISGGVLKIAGNYKITDPNGDGLIAGGRIYSSRGNIAAEAVYDSVNNVTTIVSSDVNMLRPWGPSPDNNATNVHYKHADGNYITLSWNSGDEPNIINSQVYFGTSSAAVLAATKDSAEFIGEVNAANNEPNTLVFSNFNFKLNGIYYWRVDTNSLVSYIYDGGGNITGANTAIMKSIVWKFVTHNGKAYNPRPSNGQTTDLKEPLALSWTAGDFAATSNGHLVYIGTDSSTVLSATSTTAKAYRGRQSETSYSLAKLADGTWYSTALTPGTTYYWKVSEINGTSQWGNSISTAVVWTFTPTSTIIIEDFEDYNSTADINANWMTGYDAAASCGGSSSTPSGRLTLVIDAYGKHGNFSYNESTDAQQFSEVKRYYGSTGVPFGTTTVLSIQPGGLRVDYLGAATNSFHEVYDRMYVALEDSAGNVGVYENPDGNAAIVTSWTQWYIPLRDINSAGSPGVVQLAAVSAFYLGFGERCLEFGYQDEGGDGNVMFDNIQLIPLSCDSNYNQAADFSGDCYVDLYDLQMFSDYWLARPVIISFPNPIPPSKAPILWYKFNDSGSTSAVVDYGTGDANNYTGTVQRWSTYNWNATGGRNGDRCLYIPPVPPFPTNNQSYVDAPPAAFGFLGDSAHSSDGGGVTISVWANASLVGDFLAQWPGIWGLWNKAYSSETVEVQCPSRFYTGDTTAATIFYLHTCSIRTQPIELVTYRPLTDYGGRWNHWTWVKTNTNKYGNYGSMKIYCNGELIAEADANGQYGDPNAGATGPLTEAPGGFHIGTRGNNWAMWSGYMQDFQIYDYALSDEEIEYLATDGIGYRVIPFPLKYNLYTDPGGLEAQIVNFEDLAVMGSQWHTVQLWP